MKNTKNMNVAPKGTTGYPELEKLIETENFDELNEDFEKAFAELDEISSKGKSLKKSRDAKKALKAIELTMELLKELLALKYRLQEELKNKKQKK
ncbi:MAG: hypothetical protein ABIE74_07200 [Pseudomonadota bacterium]